MPDHSNPREEPVAGLDGAIAELVDGERVVRWVALRSEPYRDVLLTKHTCCCRLFSWADGSIEIEEHFPPDALVPELRSGSWMEAERAASYALRWVKGERRSELWARYGTHESPGHYTAVAASQRPRSLETKPLSRPLLMLARGESLRRQWALARRRGRAYLRMVRVPGRGSGGRGVGL
jgi:hypothetical protein